MKSIQKWNHRQNFLAKSSEFAHFNEFQLDLIVWNENSHLLVSSKNCKPGFAMYTCTWRLRIYKAQLNTICKQCAPVKPLYLQRVQFPAIFIGAGHRVFCRSTYRLNMKNGLNFSFYLRAKPNFYFNHMHYVLRVLKTSLWNPMCQTYVFKTKIA